MDVSICRFHCFLTFLFQGGIRQIIRLCCVTKETPCEERWWKTGNYHGYHVLQYSGFILLNNLLHFSDICRTLRSSISKKFLLLRLCFIMANVLALHLYWEWESQRINYYCSHQGVNCKGGGKKWTKLHVFISFSVRSIV